METVGAVLDSRLLRAIEAAAREDESLGADQCGGSRLPEESRHSGKEERELRGRKGYEEAGPGGSREPPFWEAEGVWLRIADLWISDVQVTDSAGLRPDRIEAYSVQG